jgi:hypothetical protein
LGEYVVEQLEPVLADLLADARSAGEVTVDLTALELLYAIALLCQPVAATGLASEFNRRMTIMFIDGLRQTRP